MNIYIATVQIAVNADIQSDASVAISKILSHLVHNEKIVDWTYLNPHILEEENNPRFVGDVPLPITEGELFI